MRVLVTGGAGFIGSHVADRYLAEGWEVTVVDDLSTGRRDRVPVAARFVQLDINDPGLADLFAEGRFDFINHHAAQVDVRESVRNPVRDARVNVAGLLNILECARRFDVRRLVQVSSGGVVYGEPRTIPTPESHPLLPLSPYGVSKVAGELYVHCYAVLHGVEAVTLRYGNVYGPRQDPHGEAGVVAIFGRQVLAGEPITIFGDGLQERDYVYVEDVAESNWLASTRPLPPLDGLVSRAWNIGTGRGTSVHALADRLMEIVGRRVKRQEAPPRPGELKRSILECSAARRTLGWAPRIPLEEGLERTLASLEVSEVR